MQTLDGRWKLAIDPTNIGRDERWFLRAGGTAQNAPVPGTIQQVYPGYHGVAWYFHAFCVRPSPFVSSNERMLLRFGAVDYLADVWLNGTHVGAYEGGETPFEFDVTAALRPQAENFLAVRVLNPTEAPIDGIVLEETPHRNKVDSPSAGNSFNVGGIIYPVELRAVPRVYITDIFARPDSATGGVAVSVTVRNTQSESLAGSFSFQIAVAAAAGEVIQYKQQAAVYSSGDWVHELLLSVSQPRLWNLDDPFLYRVTIGVATAGQRRHEQSVRCGFRDCRVVDGYFQLNGKRFFLRSTHTGNHVPIGQQVPMVADQVRRDMIFAKAAGYNAVRFMGAAFPEQLDFCDEIGLLVYAECFASWLLADSPKMGERYDRNTSDMIRRDRNHPSVAIWGLLNETNDGPVFRHALAFLPKLRALDPTRLVILNSGRFDRQLGIGSLSNPGSSDWEFAWGAEADGRTDTADVPIDIGPSNQGAGDAHVYPFVPPSQEADRAIRTMGKDSKPVFFSEYGVGSLFNVIHEWGHFQQARLAVETEDAICVRAQSEAFIADWHRLGFNDVYPFPEDMLRESQRLHARQRTHGFNLIRSTPQLCGYNLTGMLDHALCGEGLWTFWREWKPGCFDAVADGWSPLRWCLFAHPMHVYAGREVTVEAVLATEDILRPGRYPATFRVFGPDGPVFEKTAQVTIPEAPTFAAPVLRETFQLIGPPGEYTFAANLESGGAPSGGRLTFHVSEAGDLPQIYTTAAIWGIDSAAEAWLASHGVVCKAFDTAEAAQSMLILVGNPKDALDASRWETLNRRIADGATALFLSAQPFAFQAGVMERLPLKNKGRCYWVVDHLYHKECVSKRHPVFAGLQSPGIMDNDYYGAVIPHVVYEIPDTAEETICASFNTGYINIAGGYGSRQLIARFKNGRGNFILSTPYILENLNQHPAADRLLLNLVRYGDEIGRRG